jgi:DNA-binding MarR family transcriptional regulator
MINTMTEVLDTLKHVQGLRQSIPRDWTQQNKQPGQRALDALRVVEQAENEGRDVFIKDIAAALGITRGRATQLVTKLQMARRVTIKAIVGSGHAQSFTTMFTAEDLAYPWYIVTPEQREAFDRFERREKEQEQERIREQEKREAEAKLWVWNPHGWIYLPDWKARYDFPNGGPA